MLDNRNNKIQRKYNQLYTVIDKQSHELLFQLQYNLLLLTSY